MKNQLTGLHILGDIYTKSARPLKSLVKIKKNVSAIIKKYRLKELGNFYHRFPGGGFTGVVSLVESHIALHTWPEFGYLTLDVYLCNYSKNNADTCKKVFDEVLKLFKPARVKKTLIRR